MAGVPYTSDYRYDGMGNRTQISRVSASGSSTTTSTANALNQLKTATTVATNSPTVTSNLYYDTAGNLTTTVNSDGSGRTTYGYDDADRLTRIERRGNAGQLVTVVTGSYGDTILNSKGNLGTQYLIQGNLRQLWGHNT